MKSRKENYYQPVMELMSRQDREMLSRKFFDFHKNLPPSDNHVFKDDVFMDGLWRDHFKGVIPIEEFKDVYGDRNAVSTACFARFYRINDFEELREDKEIYRILSELTKAYGSSYAGEGLAVAFLHTFGKQNILTRHTDPGNVGKITIPLYPDYGSYRKLHFYETVDREAQPEPSYTVDYGKIRSPVLINVDKVHEIAESQTDESLCIQLTFNDGYKKALQSLSKKRLLRL